MSKELDSARQKAIKCGNHPDNTRVTKEIIREEVSFPKTGLEYRKKIRKKIRKIYYRKYAK